MSKDRLTRTTLRLAAILAILGTSFLLAATCGKAANESTMGSWSSLIDWANLPPTLLPGGDDDDDLVATHALHIVPTTATGDTLLLLVGEAHLVDSGTKTRTLLFDQKYSGTGTGLTKPANDASGIIFCAGHAHLPTGELLVNGNEHYGNDPCTTYDGAKLADIYTHANTTEPWKSAANMNRIRSYPTTTVTADGRLLATTGDTLNTSDCTPLHGQFRQEVYLPEKNTWSLFPKNTANALLEVRYPAMFLIPTNEMLHAGENLLSQNPVTLAWRAHSISAITDLGHHSPTVLYRPDKVLRVGGYQDETPTTTAVNGAHTVNLAGYALGQTNNLAWSATDDIFPRGECHLVILPNGKVLLVGGARTQSTTDYELRPQLYNPDASGSKWSTMATMNAGRSRHSVAVLLYDGRVLLAGGHPDGQPKQTSAEIYYPPYLYNTDNELIADADRLHSVSALSSLDYNDGNFNVDYRGSQVASASLVKLSAATHWFDEDQRFVPLKIEQHQQNVITGLRTVTLSGLTSTATPPGHYMLFLLDSNGTPSKAKYVRVSDATVRFLPNVATDVTILTGSSTTSNPHKRIWQSDNDSLAISRDSSSSPRASVKVVGINSTPSSSFVLDRVDVVVEAGASGTTPYPGMKVYLRDYAVTDEGALGAWDQVGAAWYLMTGEDVAAKISVTNMAAGTYARYVVPGGGTPSYWEAAAKVTWHPVGLGDGNWVVEVDEAVVKIKGH